MLARLRDAVKAELKSQGIGGDAAKTKLRECLERVMLSCVFDVDGLWEVLADLNKPAEEEVEEGQVEEIQDSQDDDDEALSPVDKVQLPKHQTTQPGIIVVTHFSSLLTGVFTHRERLTSTRPLTQPIIEPSDNAPKFDILFIRPTNGTAKEHTPGCNSPVHLPYTVTRARPS
ncbi:hypothetical protein Neosp_003638 [[Neocosmospora] mangrovei]